jgi:uncharacterized protein (UPF0332 family)
MTLSEGERVAVMHLRLEAAATALDDAKCLLGRGSLRGVANRTYYAAYYAVGALAIGQGRTFHTHSGLIAFFHGEFVKSGVLSAAHGRVLQEAFEARTEGDYDDKPGLDAEQVSLRLQQVDDFVRAVSAHLSV